MKIEIVSVMLFYLLSTTSSSSIPRSTTAAVSAFCHSKAWHHKLSTSKASSTSYNRAIKRNMASTTEVATAFSKQDRVIRDELPAVYVYDHCPFCVRVRLALGVKNIKHRVHFMANDDVQEPTKLVGKKIAPIFAFPEANIVMAESMDIIALIDSDERFGSTGAILPASSRSDLKDWQKSIQNLLRTLQRPRYVATGLLPEFQQLDGRHAFIKNHEIPPYNKEEWKSDAMTLDQKLKVYAEAMDSDPAPLIEELNAKLVQLDDIIFSEHYCSPGGLSLDDIDLWARLRSITIIKGVAWPTKLRAYMDNLSALGDVPLYDEMAL